VAGKKIGKAAKTSGQSASLSGPAASLSTEPERAAAGMAGPGSGTHPEKRFAPTLIDWQRQHGRHDLPWQNTRDPYRIWLSEIMLQQTQVGTVIPYYQRFLQKFPSHAVLAAASAEQVLALWAGLGYYARARNLHRCAQTVVEEHGSVFPTDPAVLAELPGIGRSTAAAIAVFSGGARAAILDGNVKRVLTRCFGIAGFPGLPAVERELWALAERLLPAGQIEAYTQGLMDLGASLCARSKPRCNECPLASFCVAYRDGRTAELPTAKPKKEIPFRRSEVLLLLRDGAVLLEVRPPAGIWGGLWALPELPAGLSPEAAARELGYTAGDWQTAPPLRHVFTHFRLDIVAHRGLVSGVVAGAAREPAALRWLALEAIETAPLPAPVLKLLRGLKP